jgi:hypothetical protein
MMYAPILRKTLLVLGQISPKCVRVNLIGDSVVDEGLAYDYPEGRYPICLTDEQWDNLGSVIHEIEVIVDVDSGKIIQCRSAFPGANVSDWYVPEEKEPELSGWYYG